MNGKATFSRSTILAASDALSKLGHAGLDRFLLEIGIDAIDAGRNHGGLAARCNALAKYSLANMIEPTAEGALLADAIVEKAAELEHQQTAYGWDESDTPPSQLAQSLRREGFRIDGGKIIPITSSELIATAKNNASPQDEIENFKTVTTDMNSNKKSKVFLVHGRDDGAKDQVARYLEKLGIEVVILHERPNKGRTLITKFSEESSDVEFAVVLMTPDDKGGLTTDPCDEFRARQNVVLELGFFLGKLGPQKVCALVSSGVKTPSDFDGVVYISHGPATAWRTDLAKELREAKVKFDPSNVF
jgi:predicted nucleotide-binding protein